MRHEFDFIKIWYSVAINADKSDINIVYIVEAFR